MAIVVLLGTLDTKGPEYAYLRDLVTAAGCEVVMVNAGVAGAPAIEADVTRDAVAAAAGTEIARLVAAGDRGAAIEAMARGASAVVTRLRAEGRLDAIAALGGGGGTALATAAMRALPIGVPKLMVSTMASGDTRPYVGGSDVTMMYSVVDVAGVNQVSAPILANAAAAIAGMARASADRPAADRPAADRSAAGFAPPAGARPLVAATMFGVTTPCVTAARERLEGYGYEVLVFHATGVGGQSMENLIRAGFITACLDVTTTELADDLVGGVLSAGPERLEAAGAMAIPQVVSLGALDMVNFGPPETVPPRFAGRLLYQHNAAVTLMRTTAEECAELGRHIAAKLNTARGPVALYIPLRGISQIAAAGQVFYDPAADEALIGALRMHLAPHIERHEIDAGINDPAFAHAMADRLHALLRERTADEGAGAQPQSGV